MKHEKNTVTNQTNCKSLSDKGTPKATKEDDSKVKKNMKEELSKHIMNVKEILTNTNATPIHRHSDFGYICCYCDCQYPNPADLKSHTLNQHPDKTNPVSSYVKNKRIEYCVKLDITELYCKICNNTIDCLKDLLTHLKFKHNKNISIDIKNQILPFKFNTESITCCICSSPFEKFINLLLHMHTHYKNFICKLCDVGFVTRRSLMKHVNSHKIGTYKCGYCAESFNTPRQKKTHEKSEHTDVQNKDDKPIKDKSSHKKEMKQELRKHEMNVKEILINTNATPIHRHTDFGYVCCFCDSQHLDPADLKTHTLNVHPDKTNPISSYVKKRKIEYCVKLDITGLYCKVCGSTIGSLEDLLKHLKLEHNKDISTNIKNQILPFKFDTEPITCCICSSSFEKFRNLLVHMHTHYRNYICEVCDAGFVTHDSLLQHSATHKIGVFRCDNCPKFFDTLCKKKSHERSVHRLVHKMLKCGYCNERFANPQKKDQHLAKVHGIIFRAFECRACGKSFNCKKLLTTHRKRDHLMERRFKCSQCEMKFYYKSVLTTHMLKHTGAKEFKCDVCSKSYGRKNTLIEHIRIHKNDRRFKCEHCGQAFVQKCSWKGHMKHRHGEIV